MPRTYTPELLARVAERLKVLSEPMRLRILAALRDGEQTVSRLVEATGATQANVSRHLALLHRHRLVARRKEGLNVHYSIADPTIFRLCDLVCDALADELEDERRVLAPARAAGGPRRAAP
jgi:DNA-binding transcriptional ArsR family regulator